MCETVEGKGRREDKKGWKPCQQTKCLGKQLMGSECAPCGHMTGKGSFNCGCQDSEADRETIALQCHLRWRRYHRAEMQNKMERGYRSCHHRMLLSLLVRHGWSLECFTLSGEQKTSHNFMQMCQEWFETWGRKKETQSPLESICNQSLHAIACVLQYLCLECRWDFPMCCTADHELHSYKWQTAF